MRTAYEYDTEGDIIRLLTESRDGEGSKKTIQEAVATYRRDANGNITQIGTPEGY